MKNIIFSILLLLGINECNSQEFLDFPYPSFAKENLPEDLKGLVWNKWSTNNFIVLSIDKNQGLYIKNNIEKIKTRILNEWGYEDFNFTGDCKLVCVSNKNLLKRIFKLDFPKFEFRKNDNNQLELCAIWFSLEDMKFPISLLTELCIVQKEFKDSVTFPLFCKRGMVFLSNDLDFVKNKLRDFDSFEENILEFTNIKQLPENTDNFDLNSVILCLLMRKEYGAYNFSNYTTSKNLKQFGYENNNDKKLNIIFNKYSRNLLDDLKNNKVPDSYLIINRR